MFLGVECRWESEWAEKQGVKAGRVCSEGHEGCVASQGNVAKGKRRQTIKWRDSRN